MRVELGAGRVNVEDDTRVENNGELLIITPHAEMYGDFRVDSGGRLDAILIYRERHSGPAFEH